ncbi:uncharacterized protein DNG_07939 [Cephalotrichum gorgonifer]|uniref:Uncharacterized protein n=1 Tax=Cephalotrichum gorgonifer TaxID=2041049 RepID=A0AAE8SYQ1_9PEZI|nr:uncharacterized protein DNG_07939 [Cephalotrichum gorgonifer]
MRNIHVSLAFLCAAFPGTLGIIASGTGKDSMYLGIPIRPKVQGLGGKIDSPDDPVTSETPAPSTTEVPAPDTSESPAPDTSETAAPDTREPPAATATPPTNPIIENITWEGTGCPARKSEDEEPSLTVQLEEDGSFGAYFFTQFNAYLGWTGEVVTEAECKISMELVEIPEGWSFQISDVQAEGNIYLEKGAVALFNSTVFWSGDDEHVFKTGKYWPNLDRDTPVDQRYITDPLLLTSENKTEFASVCTGAGAGASSGTLNISFRLSLQSDVEPAPNGIVAMSALGITNRLVKCEGVEEEASPPGKCRRGKMKRRHASLPTIGAESGV